jgi:hypothetical protein
VALDPRATGILNRAVDVRTIDALIKRYGAAESRIAANLVEFDDHPTYQLLTNDTLSGLTHQRLAAVMADAPLLWRWLTQLTGILERARGLRGDGRVASDRRAELARLLDSPALLLATEEVPLAERDLTGRSTADKHVTIEQLINLMRTTYEPIRDGVAEVDRIWRLVLPRLEAGRSTLVILGDELRSLAINEPAELSAARAQMERTEALIIEDPLGLGVSGGRNLDAAVSAAAERVANVVRKRSSLSADIGSTEAILAELRVIRAVAAASWSEATAKIAAPVGLIRPPSTSIIDGNNGLAARAESFEGAGADWQRQRADVDQWFDLAERLRAQLERAAAVNATPLDLRDELRGRLSAFRAKAAATARSEDPALIDLADQAHNELFTTPTDLDRAVDLVQTFAAALRSSGEATAHGQTAEETS